MPVVWAASKAVEGFLQQPEHILLCVGVSWWRSDDGCLIIWEAGIAESILVVTLLEDTAVFGGYGGEEIEETEE